MKKGNIGIDQGYEQGNPEANLLKEDADDTMDMVIDARDNNSKDNSTIIKGV